MQTDKKRLIFNLCVWFFLLWLWEFSMKFIVLHIINVDKMKINRLKNTPYVLTSFSTVTIKIVTTKFDILFIVLQTHTHKHTIRN